MSEYVSWYPDGKSVLLNLGKLDPRLGRIELERCWNDWLAKVKVGERTYQSTGHNRLEALAELLNNDLLLEKLREEADQETT